MTLILCILRVSQLYNKCIVSSKLNPTLVGQSV